MQINLFVVLHVVHCRVGSLEIATPVLDVSASRSLPSRQLRKVIGGVAAAAQGSLPSRQLRKTGYTSWLPLRCSLPSRQLRKLSKVAFASESGSLPSRQLRKRSYKSIDRLISFTAE